MIKYVVLLAMTGIAVVVTGVNMMNVFQSYAGDYPVYGARFRGGGSFIGSSPIMTPDGEAIVFASPSRAGLGDIIIVDADGDNWRELTSSPHYEGQPDVSPDGSKIVFVSEEQGAPKIYCMDIDGDNAYQITEGEFTDHSPRFSPDGSKIMFGRRVSDNLDEIRSEEIFLVNIDGSNERRLTTNRVVDWPIKFSRDGSSIYFLLGNVQLQSGNLQYDLMRMSLDGEESECVIALGLKGNGGCDISADETTVVFVDDKITPYEYEVYTCDMDGEDVKQLTELGEYTGSVRFGIGNSNTVTFVSQRARAGARGRGTIYSLDCSNRELTPILSNTRE